MPTRWFQLRGSKAEAVSISCTENERVLVSIFETRGFVVVFKGRMMDDRDRDQCIMYMYIISVTCMEGRRWEFFSILGVILMNL